MYDFQFKDRPPGLDGFDLGGDAGQLRRTVRNTAGRRLALGEDRWRHGSRSDVRGARRGSGFSYEEHRSDCDRSFQQVIMRGYALMQNIRRGHYELGVNARPHQRGEAAFAALARTI